jgi:hypothetical protein
MSNILVEAKSGLEIFLFPWWKVLTFVVDGGKFSIILRDGQDYTAGDDCSRFKLELPNGPRNSYVFPLEKYKVEFVPKDHDDMVSGAISAVDVVALSK